jgi:hypothetical protein
VELFEAEIHTQPNIKFNVYTLAAFPLPRDYDRSYTDTIFLHCIVPAMNAKRIIRKAMVSQKLRDISTSAPTASD